MSTNALFFEDRGLPPGRPGQPMSPMGFHKYIQLAADLAGQPDLSKWHVTHNSEADDPGLYPLGIEAEWTPEHKLGTMSINGGYITVWYESGVIMFTTSDELSVGPTYIMELPHHAV